MTLNSQFGITRPNGRAPYFKSISLVANTFAMPQTLLWHMYARCYACHHTWWKGGKAQIRGLVKLRFICTHCKHPITSLSINVWYLIFVARLFRHFMSAFMVHQFELRTYNIIFGVNENIYVRFAAVSLVWHLCIYLHIQLLGLTDHWLWPWTALDS